MTRMNKLIPNVCYNKGERKIMYMYSEPFCFGLKHGYAFTCQSFDEGPKS